MILRAYPIERFFRIDLARALAAAVGKNIKSQFCSSTSTGSKTSTTHWGTRSAISSCKKLRSGLRHGGVNRTPLPV